MISDGRWQYFYDGENRLIRMESRTTVSTSRRLKLVFAYDYLSRRVKKAVYTWNTSTNTYYTYTSSESRFVYDGWNVIGELSSSGSLIRSYTWGSDLSGSLQGAGGIGGLVFVRQSGGTYYPVYDGNGNVTAMVTASDKTVAANYDYSPYGELLASNGSYAGTNPFRFSTKYTDIETNLSYFGYRYYHPETGRWLNRDPMEEDGGVNVYEFSLNNPINYYDFCGLRSVNAEEHKILCELEELRIKAEAKGAKDFAKAIHAVSKDIRAQIWAVKGSDDPAGLKIGLNALKIWVEPQKAKIYEPTDRNGWTCNKYVGDVLGESGFEAKIIRSNYLLWKRYPSANQWGSDDKLGVFKVIWKIEPKEFEEKGKNTIIVEIDQNVKFGNIISYPNPNPNNSGHTGIYLGSGLYISATAGIDRDQPGGAFQVIIKGINENRKQIYRSPEP